VTYDAAFFDHIDRGAIRSAEIVVAELIPHLQPRSLLDVGCGRGGWARVWKRAGCPAVLGIDGAHVDQNTLYIDAAEFLVADLAVPFDLHRCFDLVQCLEVAEHLPARSADLLIDNLVRHSDIVLFSAAVPGQGGMHHVNERPLEYWREKFGDRGYAAFDPLRSRIYQNATIEPWYRYNSLIYANAAGQARLPAEVLTTAVDPNSRLHEYASRSWRLRKAVVRLLPPAMVVQLSRANALIERLRFRGPITG
jgi:SAM-dependent methyltransferase